MESGAPLPLEASSYSRGQQITAVARWISVGLALLSVRYVWDDPEVRPWAALSVALGYVGYNLVSQLWLQKGRRAHVFRLLHDFADAVAIGLGAAFSGGLHSPTWLILYPHVVAVSVRAGLRYSMAVGVLDALIVMGLAAQANQPLGNFHALALLFCAFMGGTTSSHLRAVRQRLAAANSELAAANRTLSETLSGQLASQQQQDLALGRLQESEERYRRLLGRIQDGVVIIQDGRIVYANEVFAKMVGDPEGTFLGFEFLSLIDPADRPDISLRYQAWEESRGVSGSLETRVRRSDGGVLLAVVRAGGVELQGKRSVVATVRDITVQRRMEQEVREQSERLAALNEIANAVNQRLTIEDVFAVAAEETRRLVPCDVLTIALANQGAVEVVAVGTGVTRRLTDLAAPDVGWAFAEPQLWTRGTATPPAHAGELLNGEDAGALATLPLRSNDRVIGVLNLGRRRPLPFTPEDLRLIEPVARHIALALGNARLLEDVRRRGDELESLLEIGRSVVERLNPAELLPQVTRSVNRVMGTTHCLLCLRDGDALAVAAQEGLEPEVVSAFGALKVGLSLSGWVIEQGRPLAVADMRLDPRLRFGDMVVKYDYRSFLGVPLRHGDDILGTLEVVTKGAPRYFSPEEQALMQAFAHQAAVAIANARLFEQARTNLQRVVEANQRLSELDRLRREYLRNVSHEFRTPLTVIKGYSEFILEGHPTGPLHEAMTVLAESCDRMIDLVETLIEVGRIEQGEGERVLQVSRLDLREVALSSLESLHAFATRKKISVETEFGPGDLCLQGDLGLLQQVVRKLLDNALKYSAAGARVRLRLTAAANELHLEVEDAGIGIAAEHLTRIFEKFYMVDGSVARRVGGTGVGLYLVREIVRLHHGTVEVVSRPGQGSVFSVRLPRVFEAQAASA
jgi:PAS domain S-box-containing protein